MGQFLQYCEKEFDLEKIDMDRFQMNGKCCSREESVGVDINNVVSR